LNTSGLRRRWLREGVEHIGVRGRVSRSANHNRKRAGEAFVEVEADGSLLGSKSGTARAPIKCREVIAAAGHGGTRWCARYPGGKCKKIIDVSF
jgi:hypothetical protein